MKTALTNWSTTGKAAITALLIGSCLASLPVAAQDCEVKIGTVGPMSGGASAWGLSMKAAAEEDAAKHAPQPQPVEPSPAT